MESKKYHIVLASILFAILTWLSVNMLHNYVVIRHLPIVVEDLKPGKTLKHHIPRYVTIRFSGNGWLIAGLYVTPGLKYFIDASALSSNNFIVTSKDLLEHVKLPFAVQPIDVKPETLMLALDDYIEKRVPVVSNFVISYPDGYGPVGTVHMTPDSVTIGGAKETIEKLHVWHTAYERFVDLKTSIDKTIPLEEPESFSLTVLQKTIRAQINVQPFAERVFSGIPINASTTPPSYEVIFIPSKMDVIVRGGIDQLEKLSNTDFTAIVNYETLIHDSSGIIIPKLSGPTEVNIISSKPEKFQFVIRKRLQ